MEHTEINLIENTDRARYFHPIKLEISLHRDIRTFIYKDMQGEVIKQFVSKGRIILYFSNLKSLLEVMTSNKDKIISYQITCARLVVGENFII
jgi:hypothetical protein